MRNCILLLFLLVCTSLSAQELRVKSFKEASNDLSARTQARQDNNGEDCALVKVQVAAQGVTFPSGVVGSVAFKNNEYWVYMPSGSKRLKVVHPSYLPLEVNFADHGVSSVKGKSTYVLTLVLGDLPQGMTQPKIQTGWIIIDSEPTGASVYVNDEFVGNTPLNNYKQAYGTYSYRLEHPNYHASAGTIELSSARIEKKVTLLPAFGAISVTSNVTGAKVMIDGKDTGQRTPCTLQEVASGKHTVTIQMEQYAPLQQGVLVEDGKTAQLQADLSARFAKITIQSLEGAQIYCNGTQIATTQYSDNMMEGFYDLEVRLAHHESVTRQVQVVAGQPQDLTLNPIPIYGSLDVVSTPHDATVQIDGKEYGKTPLTVDQLLEGEHQVNVSADGYATDTKTVVIKANESVALNVVLDNTSYLKEKISEYIEHKQYDEALKLLRGLAEQGDAWVQYNLGWMYDEGKGVAQNKTEAVRWYRMAAEQGDSNAQSNLGWMYEKGEGVAESKSEAVRWYRKAAEQGDAKAQLNLGTMYYHGDGVAKDNSEAEKWLRKAAEQGNNDAKNALDSMAESRTFTVNGVSFVMKRVEGGSFLMGSTSEQGSDAWDNESPVHRVTLSDYYIGETEVTRELWQAVMGSSLSFPKDNNMPVIHSWYDFQRFIQKLNALTGQEFRLPTEAEWEYAARGGKKSRGYKYSGSNDLGSVAWYEDNTRRSSPQPVKTKQANELGLYDMSGNVSEWCLDWYDSYSSNAQTNPTGPSSPPSIFTSNQTRVVRGGNYFRSAELCRVSCRCSEGLGNSPYTGLRLAL